MLLRNIATEHQGGAHENRKIFGEVEERVMRDERREV